MHYNLWNIIIEIYSHRIRIHLWEVVIVYVYYNIY